jgi:hypothetical protein
MIASEVTYRVTPKGFPTQPGGFRKMLGDYPGAILLGMVMAERALM